MPVSMDQGSGMVSDREKVRESDEIRGNIQIQKLQPFFRYKIYTVEWIKAPL